MGFKPGTTDLPELKLTTAGLTITKSTTTATTTSSNAVAATQNGVRGGSITVTMDTGHSVAANTGWMIATVNCDKVLVTDTIVCNIINCNDGSSSIDTTLAAMPTNIDAGNFFKIFIKQQTSTAVPAGGGFVLNWAIV